MTLPPAREREIRHDVMAHVYAYGLDRPSRPLGSSTWAQPSCYVTDNADLILYRDRRCVISAGELLRCHRAIWPQFALRYKDLPTLGYTHLPAGPAGDCGQAGQPCGCRTSGSDLEELDDVTSPIRNFWAAGAPPAPRPASWTSSTATTAKIDEMNRRIAADFEL